MEMIDLSDIGPLIRQLRHERGLTQQDIADRLWTSRQTVSGWEHGRDMSFADVVAVLRLLGARVLIKLPDD